MLWLSAALAAIAFSVATTVRAETERVATSADGLRAWYLADRFGRARHPVDDVGRTSSYHNPDGSTRFWERNMPRMNMSFPSGDAVVEMIPESSKLNINSASPEDLLRLVTVVSGDPARAQRDRRSDPRLARRSAPREAGSIRFIFRSLRLFTPGTRLFKRSRN